MIFKYILCRVSVSWYFQEYCCYAAFQIRDLGHGLPLVWSAGWRDDCSSGGSETNINWWRAYIIQWNLLVQIELWNPKMSCFLHYATLLTIAVVGANATVLFSGGIACEDTPVIEWWWSALMDNMDSGDKDQTTLEKTDWAKCMLCQLDSKEPLRCPTKSKRGDTDTVYKTLVENINEFHQLQCMPLKIELKRLDEGNGMEKTLIEYNAKWHRSCFLKFGKLQLDRMKDRKRKSSETPGNVSKRIYTRCSRNSEPTETASSIGVCFFCSNGSDEGHLHEVCTFQLDYRVRKCAHDLQDDELLAKLSAGDLIALEAKYHAKCLAGLYNKCRSLNNQPHTSSSETTCHGTALAKLISYIQDSRSEENIKLFKLANLTKLYEDRLIQLGWQWLGAPIVLISKIALSNTFLASLPIKRVGMYSWRLRTILVIFCSKHILQIVLSRVSC